MTDARSRPTVGASVQGRDDGFGEADKSVKIMLQVASCCCVPPRYRIKLSVASMLGDLIDRTATCYDTNTSIIVVYGDSHFRRH